MKAELVPENGDPPIPITRDLTVVGRREYCDVVIADPSLSKRHCVLVKTDGLLVIRDLATTNGTKVKGQKIRWAALLPDDRLALGSYKVRIYLGPDSAPAPSELAGKASAKKDRVPSKPAPAPAPAPAPPRAAPIAVDANAVRPAADSRPTPPDFPPVVSPGASWSIHDVPEDDDSGWRNLLPPDEHENDDVVIELD
jgi:predicted component of type VI protein secretion system